MAGIDADKAARVLKSIELQLRRKGSTRVRGTSGNAMAKSGLTTTTTTTLLLVVEVVAVAMAVVVSFNTLRYLRCDVCRTPVVRVLS